MKDRPRTHDVARRARRLVVKVGSSVLTDNGALRQRVFGDIDARSEGESGND